MICWRQGGLDAELAALEEKGREEASWGEALIRVSEGLSSGRRWLWDEAARKVGVLLASPAALEGEHFLQVRIRWVAHLTLCSWILSCCLQSPHARAHTHTHTHTHTCTHAGMHARTHDPQGDRALSRTV
jgi:hypothetical protein